MPHPCRPRGTTRRGRLRILGCMSRKRAGGPAAVQHIARPLSVIFIVLPAAKALLIWLSGGPLSKNARRVTFLIAASVHVCRPALGKRFARRKTLSDSIAAGVEQHTPIARRDEYRGMGHVLLRMGQPLLLSSTPATPLSSILASMRSTHVTRCSASSGVRNHCWSK